MRWESRLETHEGYRRTPSPIERLLGMWPIAAGTTRTTAEYHNIGRVVPYYSLHLVISGALRWGSDHVPQTLLTAGDLFCHIPGVAHDYHAVPGDPPRIMYVAIDGPASGRTVEHLGITIEQPIRHSLPVNRFLGHLRLLRASFEADSNARGLMPTEYLARILGEIQAAPHAKSTATSAVAAIERGRAFIDTHCTEDITVEDVARHVGLSRSHFSTTFAKVTGSPARQYLWNRRLDHGKYLLLNTTLSVTHVASSIGFADIHSFSHAYRRRFGHAPSAMRPGEGSTEGPR